MSEVQMVSQNRETWLKLSELAQQANVNQRLIRKLVADGRVRHIRIGPKAWRFPPDALNDLIQ